VFRSRLARNSNRPAPPYLRVRKTRPIAFRTTEPAAAAAHAGRAKEDVGAYAPEPRTCDEKSRETSSYKPPFVQIYRPTMTRVNDEIVSGFRRASRRLLPRTSGLRPMMTGRVFVSIADDEGSLSLSLSPFGRVTPRRTSVNVRTRPVRELGPRSFYLRNASLLFTLIYTESIDRIR